MMPERTVIGVNRAALRIEDRGARAIDCRWQLTDRDYGERAYRAGHLPGALYANLDFDLADLSRRGMGRHPLPTEQAFAGTLSRWGITPDTDVIAYDDNNGAYAARLWWLLRLCGHERVAVLDGGYAAWVAAGLPVTTAVPQPKPTDYRVRFQRDQYRDADAVQEMLAKDSGMLIDARGATRFRGEEEPIDRVAGHVPGAHNRPFTSNLGTDGRFKTPQQLRQEFQALLGARGPADVVLMCGSGVTACHNLLAMAHADLPGARIFEGSWSGWISDPSRPVATGP